MAAPNVDTATRLVVMPGDGIGPEITAATLHVLGAADRAFDLNLAFEEVLVGFAAEHGEDAVAYGRRKLHAKGLDAVVVNDISRSDIGFDSGANEVLIVTTDGERQVPRASKDEVADAVLDETARRLEARRKEDRGGVRAHSGSAARV